MSGGQVVRVSSGIGSAIVKRSARPTEARFYARVAPRLVTAGIGLPACYWYGEDAGQTWLVLEDIPTPLPFSRDAPLPDARVLDTLQRLHRVSLPESPDAWWRPAWPESLTAQALAAPELVPSGLAATLDRLRVAAQPLFRPDGWISGDPNPMNWGIRPDGTAVLFDWERFGRGTPAIDLAITIAGLGTPDDYRTLARRVSAHYPDTGSTEELAQDIALAKCWTVVELFAGAVSGDANVPARTMTYLRNTVPGWVMEIAAIFG